MMILANYGIGSSKHKDPNSAKVLSKSLQIRTRAESALKQHLKSYCKFSDNKRNDILSTIADYYSRIPFNLVIWNKYQVKQCIVDSILLLDSSFNPFKAKEAFENVERMLVNLINLPWHKEFRKIHTYSGQFRLSISEPLIGVEEVFKASGFDYARDNIMHLVLPDCKMPQVDQGESVISVIFDCMLAQVILNNIIEIYQKCNSTTKNSDMNTTDVNYYSWIQAYFRERSTYTTEKACSNIAELLNNITNHISRLDKSSSTFLSNSNNNNQQQHDGETLFDRSSFIGTGSGTVINKSNNNSDRNSPRSSVQDRTREFLAQQSNEEDNLLTLPNDLLRLLSNVDTQDNSMAKNNKRFTKYSDPTTGTSAEPFRAQNYKRERYPGRKIP